jgi:hypothetical protein
VTLTAVRATTQERVCILGLDNPRAQIPDWESLVCPITGAKVTPVVRHRRQGAEVMAHFRLPPGVTWPDDVMPDPEYHPSESAEHVAGKAYIAANAYTIDPSCAPDSALFEERIWIPGEGKYRIADVAFRSGSLTIVHEVQLSPITLDELSDRTRDYFSAGCDVQWHFGPDLRGYQYVRWHRDFVGFPCGVLTFTTDREG